MHVIIAILYLVFFCIERSRLAKEREKAERKKKKKEEKRARAEAFLNAKKEYDKQIFNKWESLVCDLELERKVWLYLLDENNATEYVPWLQKIYDGFEGPKYNVSKMPLSRRVFDPRRMEQDPLEFRWGSDIVRAERVRAAALIMAERGKLPKEMIWMVQYYEGDSDVHVRSMMNYLSKRLSEKTGESVSFWEYGIQWKRLDIKTHTEHYWVHNGILVFEFHNPESCWMEEKKFAEKLKDLTAADDPEDIRYVQKELERMKVDCERRYQHLKDGETH